MALVPFDSTLTIPAGTDLHSPVSQRVDVLPGLVEMVRIFAPPGPRRECYLRLIHGTAQIAPARAGQWWRPDQVVIEIPLGRKVPPGETVFYLEGASPNANFSHSFDFELQIKVTDKEAVSISLQSIRDRLATLFGGQE
jgi:hypothetical protein